MPDSTLTPSHCLLPWNILSSLFLSGQSFFQLALELSRQIAYRQKGDGAANLQKQMPEHQIRKIQRQQLAGMRLFAVGYNIRVDQLCQRRNSREDPANGEEQIVLQAHKKSKKEKQGIQQKTFNEMKQILFLKISKFLSETHRREALA